MRNEDVSFKPHRRVCAECSGAIPESKRDGTRYCSRKCAQAVQNRARPLFSHRVLFSVFGVDVMVRRRKSREA